MSIAEHNRGTHGHSKLHLTAPLPLSPKALLVYTDLMDGHRGSSPSRPCPPLLNPLPHSPHRSSTSTPQKRRQFLEHNTTPFRRGSQLLASPQRSGLCISPFPSPQLRPLGCSETSEAPFGYLSQRLGQMPLPGRSGLSPPKPHPSPCVQGAVS